MPEHLGDHGDIRPGRQPQRRRAVPEIVKPYRAYAGFRDKLAEPLGDPVQRDRVAVLTGEDQAVVDVRLTPLSALGLLVHLVGQQDAHGRRVQVDAPRLTAGRLRRPEGHTVFPGAVAACRQLLVGHVHLHELLPHDQEVVLQVHVLPPQPGRLAAA
ncbi:MAG TPA: hypothetical protein VFX60_17135 [Micromonospora sp.]|nr:hypothetical protein [Micromonospora sp.]